MSEDSSQCNTCEGKKEILIYECITNSISSFEINKFLELKHKYDNNVMPNIGGSLEQKWRLLLHFNLYNQYVSAWERLWPEE